MTALEFFKALQRAAALAIASMSAALWVSIKTFFPLQSLRNFKKLEGMKRIRKLKLINFLSKEG